MTTEKTNGMLSSGLDDARGKLQAVEDRIIAVQEELSGENAAEFGDVKSLPGDTFAEKNAAFTDWMSEKTQLAQEIALYEGVVEQAEMARTRRQAAAVGRQLTADANGAVPPVQREANLQAITGGQMDNDGGIFGAELTAPTVPGHRFYSALNERQRHGMPATGHYDLDAGYWDAVYGRNATRTGDLLAARAESGDLAVVTTSTTTAANVVRGTEPTLWQFRLPNPFISVLQLVGVENVDVIDSHYLVEYGDPGIDTETDPTTAQAFVGQGATAYEVEVSTDRIPIQTERMAVFTDATRMSLRNGAEVQGIITNKLPRRLDRVLDNVILNGSGSGQPRGILQWNGISANVEDINNQNFVPNTPATTGLGAFDEDDFRDLVSHEFHTAMNTVMRTTGGDAEVGAIVVPFDLYSRLLMAKDTDGRPVVAMDYAGMVPPNILGTRVYPTQRMSVGATGSVFALMGDFSRVRLLNHTAAAESGITISTENEDNVKRGNITFVLEMIVALLIDMPQAFLTFTRTS